MPRGRPQGLTLMAKGPEAPERKESCSAGMALAYRARGVYTALNRTSSLPGAAPHARREAAIGGVRCLAAPQERIEERA